MKPSLYLLKRDVGKSFEKPKKEVFFVVVDSDNSKDYPLNFVCVLPLSQGLFSGHSVFRKLFGEDSIPLAKKLLSKALAKERDFEIKTEIGKRIKLLTPKLAVKAKCQLCKKVFEPKSFRGHYQKTCQYCKSRMVVTVPVARAIL
jgi:hypothetical protein